jgi:hypothetical protein
MLPFAFALTLSAPAIAADPNVPHEHQGKIAAYKAAPPEIPLSTDDLARLATGQFVLKQLKTESGGRGVSVQDIKAPPATVWSRIVNYGMYPKWVEHVTACGNYKTGGSDIYTRFVLDVWGAEIEYYIHHTYRPDLGWLTWTLDYGRRSDLDDSVGFWRVVSISESPAMTRVFYSVDIRIKGWVPGVVQDMIARKGLTDATSWVKRVSEG